MTATARTDATVSPVAEACVGAGPTKAPLDRPTAEQLAKTLKAVADPTRLHC